MVNIKPFCGWGYNQDKIKDFSLVITPPYDIISKEQQDTYYKRSPYNFVRLILNKEGSGKYGEIKRLFEEWQKNGILKQDDKENIYVYSETYSIDGDSFTRVGFVSLLELEELGNGILPHEKTLEKPFKDRLDLLNATKANLGLVFLLYDDKEKIIDAKINEALSGRDPDIDFVDDTGGRHCLFKIDDSDFINFLKDEMKQYQCIIADGHHRYKTALEYSKLNPGIENAKYAQMCFVNSFNEGMIILPTNRLVFGLEERYYSGFLDKLKDYFDIEEIEDVNNMVEKVEETEIMIDKKENLKNHVFGVYDNINKKSYFLKLKDRNILDKYIKDATGVYKKLDVEILHRLILGELLEISEEDMFEGTHVEFVKGTEETLNKFKLGDEKYQFAFFINPPLMREIFLTARSGETMPQKSTYFYPKVYSGLVINKIA